MITAKILYPHTFIFTSTNPEPYNEYVVLSSFNVMNLSVPILCELRNIKPASKTESIIIVVNICFISLLFFKVFLSIPSKNILKVII